MLTYGLAASKTKAEECAPFQGSCKSTEAVLVNPKSGNVFKGNFCHMEYLGSPKPAFALAGDDVTVTCLLPSASSSPRIPHKANFIGTRFLIERADGCC